MHIHDAEIAALFHHEPSFRHNASRLPVLAPAELFQAPTATLWARKYITYLQSRYSQTEIQSDHNAVDGEVQSLGQSPTIELSPGDTKGSRSLINAWAALSGIGATICEYRHLSLLNSQRITELEVDLATWYTIENCCRTEDCRNIKPSELTFCLRPLWHYTFIILNADMDILELAIGREGTNITASTLQHVKAWINSPESKRCLLHALCLQALISQTTIDSGISLHTSRIIFSAALCWYCFMLYLPWCLATSENVTPPSFDETSDYLMALPEIRLLGKGESANLLEKAMSDLRRILAANSAEMKASTLCVLETSVRRLGTGGISQKFADLIQAFITGQSQPAVQSSACRT